jgi:hypothetical protein
MIAGRPLRADHPALVCGRAGRCWRLRLRPAAGQQGAGVGGTAVVGERSEPGIGVLFVGGFGEQLRPLLMLVALRGDDSVNCSVSQLSSVLPEMMVFLTTTSEPASVMMPPPSQEEVLEAMVEFRMVTSSPPEAAIPPLCWSPGCC